MKNIYTYVGSDLSYINQNINDTIKNLNLNPNSLVKYDGSEKLNFNQIVEDLETISLFSETKLVEIFNVEFMYKQKKENKKDNSDVFLNYLSKPSDNAILFIVVNNLDLLLPEYKDILTKNSTVSVVKTLSREEFFDYTKKEFKKEEFLIKDDVIKEIVLRSNEDYALLNNNITKLITYKYDTKIVSLNDVEEMIIKEEDSKIYELTDAMTKKDKRKIYDIYTSLINHNVTVEQILNSVIQKLITLSNVKRLLNANASLEDIQNILNLKDKQAYAISKQSANFSFDILKDKLNYLLELDLKAKSGQIILKNEMLTALLK